MYYKSPFIFYILCPRVGGFREVCVIFFRVDPELYKNNITKRVSSQFKEMAAPASPKLLIPGERNILLPYANNAPHLGNIIGSNCKLCLVANFLGRILRGFDSFGFFFVFISFGACSCSCLCLCLCLCFCRSVCCAYIIYIYIKYKMNRIMLDPKN